MSEHTPYVVDTMSEDCLEYDCEHDDPDECPVTPMVACAGCTDQDSGDWQPVVEWPCLYTRRRHGLDEIKAQLLADYVQEQAS